MNDFKKIIIPILLVIIFITAAGILTRKSQGLTPFPNSTSKTSTNREIKTVTINNVSIKAEVAQTESEKKVGLSNKKSLAKDTGMLFIMKDANSAPTFWMKDMNFPIDIIWIKNDKILEIEKNAEVPSLGTPDNKLKLYSPKSAVNYVLEVNAGFSELNGFKEGDTVLIK